mgnify:CR=1 FL=1
MRTRTLLKQPWGPVLAIAVLASGAAWAQDVLPVPPPPFKGKIGRTYKDSQPDKIVVTRAPAGAPNVLVVLIDDTGYGAWGTFGGQVPTPTLDRLAGMGLRYTQFHTTSISSPTRASLLTGRWPLRTRTLAFPLHRHEAPDGDRRVSVQAGGLDPSLMEPDAVCLTRGLERIDSFREPGAMYFMRVEGDGIDAFIKVLWQHTAKVIAVEKGKRSA